jgi:hypothetical protein
MIEIRLDRDIADDPITGLRWTRPTTGKIAEVLQECGLSVSANTVARLLHGMNFTHRKRPRDGLPRNGFSATSMELAVDSVTTL